MEVHPEERRTFVSNYELFDILRQKDSMKPTSVESRQHLCQFVETKCRCQVVNVKNIILKFTLSLSRRWTKSQRNIIKFYKYNSEWLQEKNSFSSSNYQPGNRKEVVRGRPTINFNQCSERTKRRKSKNLLSSSSREELSYATRMSLNASGNRNAAEILKEITENSPKRATKIKNAYKSQNQSGPIPFTPEEALAFYVENKLTKHQYVSIRSQAKVRNANIYPSYKKLLQAKKDCYPPNDSTTINDYSVEIKLQQLLDTTIFRLIKLQNNVLMQCSKDISIDTIEMVYKWGLDGSSGQSIYKQKISAVNNITDSDLFMISIVPLQLYAYHQESREKVIIWQNPRPSSVRYCRPIKFQFMKETAETTRSEINYIEEQIKNLTATKVQISGADFSVKHKLILTMIDGKVCNSITSTSAQICYICGVSPKDINNLEIVKQKRADSLTLNFGLSTLHAWIRCFECLLHISYRLDIKTWQVRGTEAKQILNIRKKHVIDLFRTEMGLIVDQPKQGSGTSNDGNTARRFFQNPNISSRITGIDEELIRRFSVILHALSSGYDLAAEKFEKYASDTADLYIKLYKWFYMPASIHKILLHGADVIRTLILPIGQFSEEAQEARNKDYRNFREGHSRKSSRVNTNADILHMLLVSSDPYISSLRPLPKKKLGSLSPEVLSLLKCPLTKAKDTPDTSETFDLDSSDDSENDSDS